MFQLPIFVKDKDLAEVLKRLDGLVYFEGAPRYVRDAIGDPKSVQVKSDGKGGSAPEVVLREIIKRKLMQVSRQDVKTILEAAGNKSRAAPTNAVVRLTKMKFLRRVKPGVYQVQLKRSVK